MKEALESLLGLFFLAMMTTCSLACIAASIDARNADSNKGAYIAEMEESNFASHVIKAVFEDAAEQGYTIEMKLYSRNSDGSSTVQTVTAADQVGATGDVYMVRLQLTFDYSFHFLNSMVTHTLLGYAR